MKPLDYQLNRRYTWELVWNINFGKKDKKAVVILPAAFLTGAIPVLYNRFLPLVSDSITEPAQGWLKIIFYFCGFIWPVLLLYVFAVIIQFLLLLNTVKSNRHTMFFREHWIDIWSDNGLREQYPYSAINNIRITKHLMILYLEKMCRLKVVAPIPLISFPEGEVEVYERFIRGKMAAEAGFSLQEDPATTCPGDACRYHFAFIQNEEEWLETYTAAQSCAGCGGMKFKIAVLYWVSCLAGVVIFLISSAADNMRGDWWAVGLSASILMVAALGIYLLYYYKIFDERKLTAIQRRAGRIPMTRAGKKTVDMEDEGVVLCTGLERWNIPYKMVRSVVDSPQGIFIFSKKNAFICLPVWVFENETERIQILEFLRDKGLAIEKKV